VRREPDSSSQKTQMRARVRRVDRATSRFTTERHLQSDAAVETTHALVRALPGGRGRRRSGDLTLFRSVFKLARVSGLNGKSSEKS